MIKIMKGTDRKILVDGFSRKDLLMLLIGVDLDTKTDSELVNMWNDLEVDDLEKQVDDLI